MSKSSIEVIDFFKSKYPDRIVSRIYKIQKGYIIEAPMLSGDVNDPYFLVNEDCTKAGLYILKDMKEFAKAISRGPIWENKKQIKKMRQHD